MGKIFFIQQVVLAASVVANLLVAAHVFVRNPKNFANQAFFIFVIGITVLGIGIALLFTTHEFIFDRVVFLGGYTTIAGLLMLAKFFPEAQQPKRNFWLYMIPLFALAVATPFNVFVEEISTGASGELVPLIGPGFPIFAVVIGAYVVYSIYLFFKKYLHLSGLARLQIQYLLLGATLFAIAVLTFNVLLPAIGVFQLNLLGPIASVIFVGMTAYAIIRHRLMDINLIVTRAVSFLILIVLVAVAYAIVLFAILQGVAGFRIGSVAFMSIVSLATLGMLTFRPLQRIVQKLTRNIFYRGQYEADELLSSLSHIMGETIDLEIMVDRILNTLTGAMQIGKAAFFIVENHIIIDTKGVGYHDHEYVSGELDMLFHKRYASDPIWTYEDLDESLKKIFRKLDISVAIPIRVESDEVAILILGPKLSGEIYYQNEIDLLSTFADEAGVAIQNARSYVEVKRLNEGLEDLVEQRTKELKESQAKELAKAREVVRLRDEFVFIAVHELRAPVAAIKGFLQLIEDVGRGDLLKVKDYMGSISVASAHLGKLVDDILKIARAESGASKIEVRPIDAVLVLEYAVRELSSLANQRSVQIKIKKPRVNHLVLANTEKVKEIFVNLISNGIKYNKVGGTLEVNVFEKGRSLAFEFKDNGVGIPKDEQDKIFQKFFRTSLKEVREVRGTGLGLFITRMLIEKMGGKITFSSIEGKGTTFTVTLPLFKD